MLTLESVLESASPQWEGVAGATTVHQHLQLAGDRLGFQPDPGVLGQVPGPFCPTPQAQQPFPPVTARIPPFKPLDEGVCDV